VEIHIRPRACVQVSIVHRAHTLHPIRTVDPAAMSVPQIREHVFTARRGSELVGDDGVRAGAVNDCTGWRRLYLVE
jgi:hypothetical protein